MRMTLLSGFSWLQPTMVSKKLTTNSQLNSLLSIRYTLAEMLAVVKLQVWHACCLLHNNVSTLTCCLHVLDCCL